MGSPDFAVPVLDALAAKFQVVGIVTQPDRPAGRGQVLRAPPVKEAALRLGLPLIQPEKLRQPEAMTSLQAWKPDLIVVAAFGQILRPAVLDLPPLGCINVHASLLPRWRGAAPIQAAILAGDARTGITIMKMDPGVDTGPILSQRAIPITPQETGGSLFTRLATLGAELLMETLPAYLDGKLLPQPQPAEGATYAPMLTKEDARLDASQPAAALERRVRAFHPHPGAWIDWQDAALKILHAHTAGAPGKPQPPGTHTVHDGLPAFWTGDSVLLLLDEVQPAGRKSMPGRAFLSGARRWAE